MRWQRKYMFKNEVMYKNLQARFARRACKYKTEKNITIAHGALPPSQ